MLPSASSSHNTATLHNDPRNPQDRTYRPPHPNTQLNMGFVAGSASSGGYGNWGGGNIGGGGMNDPFTPSRSHYQPGFLMSVSQNNVTPPGGQHIDDPPLIPTKFNPSASRASPSEFGLESMFERPTVRRQRQPANDEDAPPTTSVNDIIDEPHTSPFQRRDSHSGSGSPLNQSTARRQPHTQQHPQVSLHQPVTYLNVFGYPPDRYDSVTRLFQSLGETTEPEPSENGMWFTIGFRQPWEAERALRRNGKLMDDTYMLGVSRASSPAADVPSDIPRTGAAPANPGSAPNVDPATPGKDSLVATFGIPRSATSSLGMPLTLAPSTTAFKTPSAQRKAPPPHQPQPGHISESSTISKISDIIFGW
ncbi:hypothetical protein JB92DRAFT_3134125 [Gautieria morchelliformis]|nr:hypothetical protein JB92DRAFT_3134125 [Gautieria morchelliformis]